MPDKIERVVLFHDYSEALGGASYLVQVLIEELRSRDVPVTFFAGDTGTNFGRDDVEFIPLNGKSLLDRSTIGALTKGLFNPPSLFRVRDWIRKNDTPGTIYHVHGWTKILSPAVFGALRDVSLRVILHGHDYFNSCPNGAFFNYVTEQDCSLTPLSAACLSCRCDKSSYAHKLWRSGREAVRRVQTVGANANRMLLIHPGQARNFALGHWPAEKLVAVRNPVTPLAPQRIEAERNNGIIYIGRISAEKGADLAAKAAAMAGIPITFVGDGSEVDHVRAINPDAIMLGRQDRAGAAKALSRAKLAVMPSRWAEPFGLVALEAIGSGVPVIVSNRALVAPEIERAGFGLSANTANLEEFARTLLDLHADNARVKRMSTHGHKNYLNLCNTPESWANTIVNQYEQALL
ncbi:glycosyltransferase family 4 protein [Novosphingobium aerophilum]|uniref:glycosyltransferase family 4 protein n=1 Tax=Novosphingobium TaxID=165696 RepID=UPI002D76B292|nr:glycosyltransferase family 4 protein [Novosphingobium sp. RL4]WRT93967.1 glycosyltransferase family 4 protein [Novosphingobium sp. RL4]